MGVRQTEACRSWLDRLRDPAGRARILVRVDPLIHGNPGDHRSLPGGVCELRIAFGPGYRVYYTQRAEQFLLLLIGGDKSTQAKDVAMAQQLAKDYQE